MPERGAAAAERNGTYMKQKKWPLRLLSGGLVTAALVGVAVAAGQQGSQSDPLVTLSYLQQQALPQVLEDVDEKVAARQSELEDKLSAVADGYAAEVEAALSGSAGTGSGSQTGGAVYQVVELSAGQTLTGSAACELLLRSGTATCVSDSSPGLVDMTDGSTLANGGALKANHLYLATIEGRGFTAQNAVKVLVRGSYTVS